MDIRYHAVFEPEADGRFFVRFLDFEDIFTQGETQEECLFNASEVLSGMLGLKLEDNDDIPVPGPGIPGSHAIAPDAKVQSALLIRFSRGERSMSELARVLETSWPAAKRLEDARHWPSLKTLDKAAAALGKRLVLTFE